MAAFGLPGGMEWWIILGIILLLFGPTQLPKLAKMFGKSAKALKEGMDEGMNAIDEEATTKKAEKVDKVARFNAALAEADEAPAAGAIIKGKMKAEADAEADEA